MRLLFILLFALISLSSNPSLAEPPAARQQEWLIDTDVGPDDAIALLYLLKQPSVKVTAITIESDGNAHCQPAFANVAGLLQLAGQRNIPLACGRSTPLRGTHHFPQNVLDSCDRMANTPLPQSTLPRSRKTAKDLMIETLNKAAKPMNILAIGPLTTLAEVFEQQPQLKAKVHMVYIMGGAIRVPGNIHETVASNLNQSAEWNIYLDPYAADQLFHSGLPLTLVPLDVTNQALVDHAFYEQLQQQQQTPAAKFVSSLLDHKKQQLQSKTWYLWDPLAALIAMNESLTRFEVLPLSVRQEPEAWSGATVIDKKHGGKVRVSIGIQSEKLKRQLITGLNQG